MGDSIQGAAFATEPEFRAVAEARYRNSQAAYFDAQTVGQNIDNRTAAALAASAEIALNRERMKDAWEGASNGRNRVYHFTDAIGPDSVEAAIDVLNRWERLDHNNPARPWRFVICSNGGTVIFGMKLYSTLSAIAAKRPLITIASGFCASMGTIVHQAGSTRLIEPGTTYMIHDVSGTLDGKITDMQDTMDWLNKVNSSMHSILASKSHMNAAQIAEMSKRRDSWLLPDEVIEKGFADAIGYATE